MRRKKREALIGYVYILPSFLLLLTFSIIPILLSLFYSFTKYNILQPPVLVGLQNYARMIKDDFVWTSLKNTVIFTAVTVPLQTISALVLAAVIIELFYGKFGNFIKSSLFVPVISSGILIGTLWFTILAPRGVINNILGLFHIPAIAWLGGRYTSLISVCLVSVWKGTGYFLVIYFAGILDIPRSYYESAKVDGANYLQRFFRITLPELSNVTFLVIILGTIWSFQVFDMVYTMTGGGPGTSTITLVLTIYNSAFKEHNMGYASAVAMLMFFFIMLISLIQKLIFARGDKNA